jgi:hypothetical protein
MKKVILLIVLAFSLSINAQEKSGDNFQNTINMENSNEVQKTTTGGNEANTLLPADAVN